MDLELRGKVAVVSAATKGIGFESALGLAREGARLALFSRDPQNLDNAARQITASTGVVPFVKPADLGDADSLVDFFEAVRRDVGAVDILVANSAGPAPGRFESFNDDDWMAAFEKAFLSTARMIRQVIPHMLERGGGSVVAIQSSSVKQPIQGLVLSNGVRPGVAGLMKSLAGEYGEQGLRFNVVCPGRIMTDRFIQVESSHGQPLEQRMAKLAAEIPMRRFGTPREVADTVVFPASARASYVTGSVVAVDGGNVRSLY